MPVQKCQKDGKSGYKWGENGVCFIGDDAQEKAAAVGRAIHVQNNFSSIIFELAEDISNRVQVARVGTFNHEIYGKFSITAADLNEMKANFNMDVRRQKIEGKPVLPFDYSHYDGDRAAGWIVALEIDGGAMYAKVEWTPKAAEKIRNNEFKFVSPSIHDNYKDAETGKKYKKVLMGAALTNVPFLRDMEAVHLLSEPRRAAFESLKLSGDNPDSQTKQGSNMPTFAEILEGLESVSPEDKKALKEAAQTENRKLSEDSGKLKEDLKKTRDDLKLAEKEKEDLKTKMSGSDEVGERLKLAESEAKDLKGQVISLTKKMAENDKKADFDKMLSEGKVCEAQRKAFMEDNMAEFAKNAQEVKLSESGTNAKGDETAEEAADELIKLAEKKAKEDEIEFGDAMSKTLSENPDLKKKAGY